MTVSYTHLVMHIIDTAFAAMKAVGVEPRVKAIRGGTDGAQLSFKGLPCPCLLYTSLLEGCVKTRILPAHSFQRRWRQVCSR